jgi:hypothetical protein
MTDTMTAPAVTLQAANEWLATLLRGTDHTGGLYPARWDPRYHEQFRAALDAGALLMTGPPNARSLFTAIQAAVTEEGTFQNFGDEYQSDLGRWLLDHYAGYLLRAFPLGSRWACATGGADFSGFRTDYTLERVSYPGLANGVDEQGRVYFRRVGDDDTPVGGTQFLYPASIRPLVPTTVGYPTPPDGFTNYHQSAIQAAEVWVNDGVRDVMTGVDAQMVAWREWWPNDACGSDAAAKDYASALMEQKCRTLGIPFPVEPAPVADYSTDWDRATPLASGEVYPAMTVLVMAVNPRTADDGGVYFANTEPVLVHLVSEHTVSYNGRASSPSVRRVDGLASTNGMMTQVVGEQYLRIPAAVGDEQVVETPAEPTSGDASEIERLRVRLREVEERHRTDIATIGETLMREAERRNWCSEYDEIVDGINSRITVELPVRNSEEEFEVTVSGYVRVPFSYSMTVTASDSGDAHEIASNTWADQVDAGDLLRDYSDRYSAEVEDDYEIEVD